MKILIAVPCMDTVPVQFCHSLALLKRVEECTLIMKSGSLIYTARNEITLLAIQKEYDLVLWLDSDMVFMPDTLIRMLKTLQDNDLDILTGLYFRRVPPFSPVLFDKLEEAENGISFSEFTDIPDKLFEVGGCGFGCVLMKTDVFIDVNGKFGRAFTPFGENGEDIAFCIRARDCGYKIMCDPSIVCGHVGHAVIDGRYFQPSRNRSE